MAAKVEIIGDRLHVSIEGIDRVLALRVHLDLALSHVRGVRADPEAARGFSAGIKGAGARIPGVVTAGSFYSPGQGGWTFYDVHDPARAIVVELTHEHYRALVLEVDDPPGTVATLIAAMGATDGGGSGPG
ncbi:MAG TPA: hypothetical protein VMW47_07300 [Verrucomicrobiae bacterium]|nr:hypothetical protein [Verrucomicrobiae bacterium]